MNDKQEQGNIIQFPGKKKEAEDKNKKPSTPAAGIPPTKQPSEKPVARRGKGSLALAGTVAAVILFTGAVNKYTFSPKSESADLSSMSRSIASVERVSWQRDANWEKKLAERLASSQVRDVASAGVGHEATVEEKLRWGTLEEKYTILFQPKVHVIDSIVLQDSNTNPAYILDRHKFLRDYGILMKDGFASAKLKSVEVSHDRTVEAYTLYDKNNHATSEARFELDNYKRLLSLKVEPSQI